LEDAIRRAGVTFDKALTEARKKANADGRPYCILIRLDDQRHYVKPLDQIKNESGLARKIRDPRTKGKTTRDSP